MHTFGRLIVYLIVVQSCSDFSVRLRSLDTCTPQYSFWGFDSDVKLNDYSAFLGSETILLVPCHFVTLFHYFCEADQIVMTPGNGFHISPFLLQYRNITFMLGVNK